jgi:predicted metalloprotease with PDZ domain
MTITPNALEVLWQNLILYPVGYYVRDLPVTATLKLPASFYQASSLEAVGRSGDVTTYKDTTMERLADSPVYAGRYFEALDLTPSAGSSVTETILSPVSRVRCGCVSLVRLGRMER